MLRIGARFCRVEARRRVRAFVLGLLAELPRKNCWTIAEHPRGCCTQRHAAPAVAGLLGRDGVRDDIRSYAVEHLGDPHGMLVVDGTGMSGRAPARPGYSADTPGQVRAPVNTWRECRTGPFDK